MSHGPHVSVGLRKNYGPIVALCNAHPKIIAGIMASTMLPLNFTSRWCPQTSIRDQYLLENNGRGMIIRVKDSSP